MRIYKGEVLDRHLENFCYTFLNIHNQNYRSLLLIWCYHFKLNFFSLYSIFLYCNVGIIGPTSLIISEVEGN